MEAGRAVGNDRLDARVDALEGALTQALAALTRAEKALAESQAGLAAQRHLLQEANIKVEEGRLERTELRQMVEGWETHFRLRGETPSAQMQVAEELWSADAPFRRSELDQTRDALNRVLGGTVRPLNPRRGVLPVRRSRHRGR